MPQISHPARNTECVLGQFVGGSEAGIVLIVLMWMSHGGGHLRAIAGQLSSQTSLMG